jgi:arylsulfatase A-like enzyme
MSRLSYTRRDFLKAAGLGAAVATLPGCATLSHHSTARDKRPNILFFFPDQHRFDWLGNNRALPVRTPNLDSLADRGVLFANALCPSPLCAPSRACLAGGKEYDHCGVPTNGDNYPVEQTTFYTLLRDSGYHVMGCGKFDLRKPAKSWGPDGKHHVDGKCYLELWGFSDGIDSGGKHDGVSAYRKGIVEPYMAFLAERNLAEIHADDFRSRHNYKTTTPTLLGDDAYADNWIAENGLELIRKAPADKPWFLQVNFNGPHEPMDVTKRMKDRWQGVAFPGPNGSAEISAEKHSEIRQNYSAMVENIDRYLGIYIEYLRKTGQLENTLIVYSSDHGEMLGDHDRWAKYVPYQASVGVPLIIAGPGVIAAEYYKPPVTTMDLAATFLDYASVPVPKSFDSISMKPILQGNRNRHREYVYSGINPWRSVFDGRYKLVRGFDPANKKKQKGSTPLSRPVLLFDLQRDPLENVNIADDEPEIVERLTKALESA